MTAPTTRRSPRLQATLLALALDLSPEGELDEALVDVLANRPPGARSVLLSARPVNRLPVHTLADQLSRAGHRCVHVVPVSLEGGATRRSVVGTVALGDPLVSAQENRMVLVAAVSEEEQSAVSTEAVDALEAALVSAAERAAAESHARNLAEAELVQRSLELAAALQELRAFGRRRPCRSGAGWSRLSSIP